MKKLMAVVMGLATGIAGAVELLPSGGDDAPTVQAALDAADEVAAMAKYYGAEDKLSEIKRWYDGYDFADGLPEGRLAD